MYRIISITILSSENSSGDQQQRDLLGGNLAEQLVEDEPARGSNPARTLLICLRR